MSTKIIGIFLGISLLGYSCKKDACDDPVPALSYSNFKLFGDSLYQLEFEFKDCDGDIGLTPEDTSAPFNFGGDYYYNFRVDVLYRENGAWEVFDFNGGVGIGARIIPLAERDDEVVEGTIEHYVPTFDLIGAGDTIKFRATLIDRALNESNPAESEAILLPN